MLYLEVSIYILAAPRWNVEFLMRIFLLFSLQPWLCLDRWATVWHGSSGPFACFLVPSPATWVLSFLYGFSSVDPFLSFVLWWQDYSNILFFSFLDFGSYHVFHSGNPSAWHVNTITFNLLEFFFLEFCFCNTHAAVLGSCCLCYIYVGL